MRPTDGGQSEGQPKDNLGCPCLIADYQYITSQEDNRTTYSETSVLKAFAPLVSCYVSSLLTVATISPLLYMVYWF